MTRDLWSYTAAANDNNKTVHAGNIGQGSTAPVTIRISRKTLMQSVGKRLPTLFRRNISQDLQDNLLTCWWVFHLLCSLFAVGLR